MQGGRERKNKKLLNRYSAQELKNQTGPGNPLVGPGNAPVGPGNALVGPGNALVGPGNALVGPMLPFCRELSATSEPVGCAPSDQAKTDSTREKISRTPILLIGATSHAVREHIPAP